MNTFYVYLWTIADNVREMVFGVGIGCIFAALIACFFSLLEVGYPFEIYKGIRKVACIVGAIVLIVYPFIPSSKNLALIYVLPRIADSKVIQKDLPELYDMAVVGLKSKLTNAISEIQK